MMIEISYILEAFGFMFYFTPLLRVLFTFPSRYFSLSVTQEYLALRSGLRGFVQDFTCLIVLGVQIV